MSTRPIAIIVGVGASGGTGAATALTFAKAGYSVAVVARNPERLEQSAQEIKSSGGDAAAFPAKAYDFSSFASIFADIKKKWPGAPIRAAVYNASHFVWKPFLQLSEAEIQESVDTSVVAAFGFSQQVIQTFKENELNEDGKRGTLIFTGATASTRGSAGTSAFAAGKHGMRALSQSLAKEFGKDNIHVAHAIIDGGIKAPHTIGFRSKEELENPAALLDPESIAKSYLALTKQDRSALTWELDLRPAHEKW